MKSPKNVHSSTFQVNNVTNATIK